MAMRIRWSHCCPICRKHLSHSFEPRCQRSHCQLVAGRRGVGGVGSGGVSRDPAVADSSTLGRGCCASRRRGENLLGPVASSNQGRERGAHATSPRRRWSLTCSRHSSSSPARSDGLLELVDRPSHRPAIRSQDPSLRGARRAGGLLRRRTGFPNLKHLEIYLSLLSGIVEVRGGAVSEADSQLVLGIGWRR